MAGSIAMRILVMAASLAVALAGCTMLDSKVIDGGAQGFGCASYAGAYFLPKTVLLVEVVETTPDKAYVNSNVAPTVFGNRNFSLRLSYRRIADTRFPFCLDYLTSATAQDTINVKKVPHAQLLAVVSTDAIDESRYIVQNLIRSAFIVASGDPNFGDGFRSFASDQQGARVITAFKAEFDPLDAHRTAEINDALKDFGFCLVMPSATVSNPTGGISAYCEHPRAVLKRAGAPVVDYRFKSADGLIERGRGRGQGGVFYRPRVPHAVLAYIKDNPRVPQWRLAMSRAIEMENDSPIISVGIERTFFAQRRTTLKFDEGSLESVCVAKGSELLGASYIPLQVAQSIVQLPTSVVKVQIDQTANLTDLAKAEQQLISVQRQHMAFLEGVQSGAEPGALSPPTPPTPTNSPLSKGTHSNPYTTLAATPTSPSRVADTDCGGSDDAAPGLKFQNIVTPAGLGAATGGL